MAEKQEPPQPEALREITIQLDNYDDIFSDFDPRPFANRELSEDFLKEISRRYHEDRKGRFEVHFTLPASSRDPSQEALIKKRLREHFAFVASRENEFVNRTKGRGYLFMAVGFLILLADTGLFFTLHEDSPLYHVLSILLIPAGWFGMFTGIGKVVDDPYDAVERKKVYEKFEKANYIFTSDERE